MGPVLPDSGFSTNPLYRTSHIATEFINSTIRGRLGNYRLQILRDRLASGESAPATVELEITDLSPLRWGRAQLGYSPFILPSFVEVVFFDPDGLVRDTFNAPFDELDFPVVITGPGFLWRGVVRRGLVGRPVAVRVHKQQTSVFLYDRLQALRELTGISTVDTVLTDMLRGIFIELNPGPDILGHLDLKVTNATLQQSFSQRRWNGELVGSGRGDYGTAFDQIEAFCRSHGLMCFMNTTTGLYNLVHRASLPLNRTTAVLLQFDDAGLTFETQDQTRTAVVITPEITGRRADEFITNQGTGTITLIDVGSIDWIVDGTFDVHDETETVFTYWTTTGSITKNAGTDRVITGGGGGSTSQFVGSFSPETDVRPRFRFDFFGNNVRCEITLVTAGGTVHYLADNGLWTTTVSFWSFSTSVVTQATVVALSGEDFPAAGDVSILLSAAGSLRQWGDVEMFLIDGAGAVIDDWTFSIGTGEGANIELQSTPGLEAGPGPVFVPATLESELTGIGFTAVNGYLVSDRLAQDTPGLDNIKGGVFAVAGPEAVLSLTDDAGVLRNYVGVGGDIDFEKGTTQGVWLALDDLEGTVGS